MMAETPSRSPRPRTSSYHRIFLEVSGSVSEDFAQTSLERLMEDQRDQSDLDQATKLVGGDKYLLLLRGV